MAEWPLGVEVEAGLRDLVGRFRFLTLGFIVVGLCWDNNVGPLYWSFVTLEDRDLNNLSYL